MECAFFKLPFDGYMLRQQTKKNVWFLLFFFYGQSNLEWNVFRCRSKISRHKLAKWLHQPCIYHIQTKKSECTWRGKMTHRHWIWIAQTNKPHKIRSKQFPLLSLFVCSWFSFLNVSIFSYFWQLSYQLFFCCFVSLKWKRSLDSHLFTTHQTHIYFWTFPSFY